MSALGLYAMDGEDLYGSYGFIVKKEEGKGKDPFLKFWDSKPIAGQKDWADQDGIEVDLSRRFFQAKEILLSGTMVASGEDDFWEKHEAFYAALSAPGIRRMYVGQLKRSFYIFYDSCTDFGTLTPIIAEDGQKVACKYTLKFIEPSPSFFKKFAFLTDKDGNYLVTQTGNKLIVT